MTPTSSQERLNAIIEHIGGINRYLEIGVAKGSTFFEVAAIEKHAVDPRFRFNPKVRSKHKNEKYHLITSDEYFLKTIGQEEPFDLIFLDGLHTYSQTLRDFLASQALAHQNTIWVIDDTVPTDAIAAEPDLSKVQAARKIAGCPEDQTWMGDVFKVIAFIDSFCPQYTSLTIEGHGQTIVLQTPRKKQKGKFTTTKEIEDLTYTDSLLLREDLLKPTPFKEILRQIKNISQHR